MDAPSTPAAYSDAEWQQRLEAAVADTIRRRTARLAERQQLDARRQAGLTARHGTKLARNRQRSTMPDDTPAVLTIDTAGLTARDLRDLAHAATRVAGARSISIPLAAALGRLAASAADLARAVGR